MFGLFITLDDDDPRAAEHIRDPSGEDLPGPRSEKAQVGNRRSLNGLLASNSWPDDLIFQGTLGAWRGSERWKDAVDFFMPLYGNLMKPTVFKFWVWSFWDDRSRLSIAVGSRISNRCRPNEIRRVALHCISCRPGVFSTTDSPSMKSPVSMVWIWDSPRSTRWISQFP